MGLTSAMRVGQSALAASQLGLEVTGNNMANVATPGYARRRLDLTPLEAADPSSRFQAGLGVGIRDLTRTIDEAVLARLRGQYAREAATNQSLTTLSQLESSIGELSDFDLTSQLSSFFGTWSDRSTLVAADGVVVQQAETLVSSIRRLRDDLVDQKVQGEALLEDLVPRVDDLLGQVASLNEGVARAGVSGGDTASLRDQRDQVLDELAGLIDIDTIERGGGQVDVYVGSTPLVLAGASRGIEARRETIDGESQLVLRAREDGAPLPIRAGRIGALLQAGDEAIGGTIDQLDRLASELIFQANRIHATATGPDGLREAASQVATPPEDRGLALTDPANATFAELPFEITNGSFLVQVHDRASGTVTSTRIEVDLDGIADDGTAGGGDDTTLENVRAALDAVDGVRADFTADGRLRIRGDAGTRISFGEDTSGLLGAVGVNAFFSGRDASDIAVRSDIAGEPGLLNVGRINADGAFDASAAAIDMARLQDRTFDAVGGQSLQGFWAQVAGDVGAQTDAAITDAEASRVIREAIEGQRAAVSGVSLDEEAINLSTYQQAFQASARYISVLDQLQQELLAIF
ncbi:MAG: flagellar hook-associated protein FlgK [Planctomycetota bacterium]